MLFSITKKDFRIDTFRAGGKGGQGQNKRSVGVRITHLESGAVGEGRDSRSRIDNQKAAFHRCISSPRFQAWFRLRKAAARLSRSEVEKALDPKFLKIEVQRDGKWVEQ